MRKFSPIILLILALALLTTLALAFDLSPLLRGGAGWRWPYEIPAQPAKLIPGTLALIAYLVIGEWWLAGEKRPRLFLWFCVLGGLAVQLAFLYFYGNPIEHLFLRTISTVSGGFFEVGVNMDDVLAVLRHYPELMPDWTAHPKAHPPGIPLLFWGAKQLFGLFPGLSDLISDGFRYLQCHHRTLMALPDQAISAAVLGMALPLFSLLSIGPAYRLTENIYDRPTALRAALWLPLIPALVMFTPQWNQFYMLLAAGGLWLTHRALTTLKTHYMIWLGLLMSAATFISFTNANLIGLCGLYGLIYIGLVGRLALDREDWKRLLIGILAFIPGFVSLWVIYYAISGVTVFDLFSTALTIHYGLKEPYLPWLFFFPMDLFLFSGLAAAGFAIAEIVQAIRGGRQLISKPQPEAVLPFTLLFAVLVLNFSGLVRGEVGRLLLWLMPVLVIVAACAVTRLQQNRAEAWLSSAVLAIQLVIMVGFLRVIGTELAPRPAPDFVSEPPAMQFVTQTSFDGKADLIGYEANLNPTGDALDLTLYWRSTERFDPAYFVSAVVIGPEGQPLGVNDWLPVEGGYPTSCWRPGEVVIDQASIPLDSAPPGDYWLSVALFDFETNERLVVTLPDGQTDTQVGLGPIPIR